MNENPIRIYKSSVINIGPVPLGGDYPIRIQSMTNTDTLDTKASVNQCIRIIEAGADFVRLTAQGIREAENLALIKRELRRARFFTPLIADIHFNPAAAEIAARLVEKVRINPGNYADKRASFEIKEFTDKGYEEELERIHTKLLPLINISRENGTVIRIGINHGSLSDRIMTRFGNTPEGMVFSALEFIRVFRSENFKNLVLSMKSSDSAIMIQATRLLVKTMQDEHLSYPMHLGVTEAGEGEDGRIRSAAGIGALLAEGIGDTIRVSLSEDPEQEIPVAQKLVDFFPRGISAGAPHEKVTFNSPSVKPGFLKSINGPLVISDLTTLPSSTIDIYEHAGYTFDQVSQQPVKTEGSADLVLVNNLPEKIPENVTLLIPETNWNEKDDIRTYPVFSPETFSETITRSGKLNVLLTDSSVNNAYLETPDPDTTLLIFSFDTEKSLYEADFFLNSLEQNKLRFNVILSPLFHENNVEMLQVKSSALLGRYVMDRRIAGICIRNSGQIEYETITTISFSILQCTETRITRTMYLSCPTCGRTKFNLQESVRKVKEATGHLKGLKIAIMGCIVNGPGEMAGADYGYVGAAPGKVHIYKGTIPVLKNVPEEDAVKELLKVIEKDR
jgi:(E)-4-hydroxy-3-methylbut-2-enyl-diphosphate synthase